MVIKVLVLEAYVAAEDTPSSVTLTIDAADPEGRSSALGSDEDDGKDNTDSSPDRALVV